MKAICHGGTHDGEEVEAQGTHVVFPFSDGQHIQEYHDWFVVWGVTHAMDHPTPPAPRFPAEIYNWLVTEDGVELQYVGVER